MERAARGHDERTRARGGWSSCVLVVGSLAMASCDREPAPAPRTDSVLGLLLAIDDALRRGSEPALSALMVDLEELRKRCPAVTAEDLAAVEASRAEDPLSACVGLTDWSQLQRGVPLLPFSGGLNVDTKICGKAWGGCDGVTLMCKSEIFYFAPQAPQEGFKVNLSGIVGIDGEYRMLRPPRCVAKSYSR